MVWEIATPVCALVRNDVEGRKCERKGSPSRGAPLQGELAFVRYEQMTEGLMEDCISINPSGSPFATHLPYEGRL